jgi:hypothetical protein
MALREIEATLEFQDSEDPENLVTRAKEACQVCNRVLLHREEFYEDPCCKIKIIFCLFIVQFGG